MPHIHEKIDFTVGVYICKDDRVLLVHHRKFKCWLSVGGHIELDEDPIEALHREVKEEAGIEITIIGEAVSVPDMEGKSLVPPRFMDIHPVSATHRHIGMYYIAVPKDVNAEITLNVEEHLDIKWFTKEELLTLKTTPAMKLYASIALDEVKKFVNLS